MTLAFVFAFTLIIGQTYASPCSEATVVSEVDRRVGAASPSTSCDVTLPSEWVKFVDDEFSNLPEFSALGATCGTGSTAYLPLGHPPLSLDSVGQTDLCFYNQTSASGTERPRP